MNETAEKMLIPEEVKDYLLANPDFFLEHQDLFTEINFPHETSGAVSLIERQVQVLRESQKESLNRVSALTATATINHELLKKMQLLTLKLIGAEDSASLLTCLNDLILDQFELDRMQLLVSDGTFDADLPLTETQPADKLTQLYTDIFNLDIYVGRVPAKLGDYFSEAALENIGSIALLKLNISDQPSYLLLGSSNETRFQSDMATDFIEFVANVFSILLKRSLGKS